MAPVDHEPNTPARPPGGVLKAPPLSGLKAPSLGVLKAPPLSGLKAPSLGVLKDRWCTHWCSTTFSYDVFGAGAEWDLDFGDLELIDPPHEAGHPMSDGLDPLWDEASGPPMCVQAALQEVQSKPAVHVEPCPSSTNLTFLNAHFAQFMYRCKRHPDIDSDCMPLFLRPVVQEDAPALRAGFGALSSRSRFMRFLRPMQELSDDALAYLTRIDHCTHFAWLIGSGTQGIPIPTHLHPTFLLIPPLNFSAVSPSSPP